MPVIGSCLSILWTGGGRKSTVIVEWLKRAFDLGGTAQRR
jgi:hypothetical protein